VRLRRTTQILPSRLLCILSCRDKNGWPAAGDRNYRDLLTELGIAHTYAESEGNHSWPWWDLHIQDALACLLDETP